MPSKFLRTGDEAIHYLYAGPTTLPDVPPALDRGAPVLLVHGEGGSAGLWRAALAELGSSQSPVAIDLPAHGRSSGLEPPPTAAAAVAVLADFLAAMRAGSAIVVGHGYGGHLALALAAERPDLVRGVAAIGAALRGSFPEEHLDKLRRVVQGRIGQPFDTPYFGSKPDMGVVRAFWTEMVKTDPRVRLADVLAYAASELGSTFGRVRAPLLVIRGDEDRLCTAEAAEALAGAVPGARLLRIPGAGHVAHLERPEEVWREVGGLCG